MITKYHSIAITEDKIIFNHASLTKSREYTLDKAKLKQKTLTRLSQYITNNPATDVYFGYFNILIL